LMWMARVEAGCVPCGYPCCRMRAGHARDAAGLKDAKAERRLVAGRGGCEAQGGEGREREGRRREGGGGAVPAAAPAAHRQSGAVVGPGAARASLARTWSHSDEPAFRSISALSLASPA
jgi:hypothetical protein